ncbi:MAG: BTAD domain-containing putative transcriptional regulator [Casimicrobiaceae bacterium]
MPVRPPALAKLTRPRVFDTLARPRLFTVLDGAAARAITWVCGPPGAGKSTLVASYVEARKLRCLWFQIDVADADPATFVHYLRLAAIGVAGKAAAALPLFTAPQQDLARFARGFFRDLFMVLPHPCVIVLDNFHEARATTDQRAALAQGLEEIPEGVRVVVISRGESPPEFARLVASQRLARVPAASLNFTPDEAEAMLAKTAAPSAAIRRIQRQSDGWAAALVLMREHLRRPGAVVDESLGDGKDAIFQYFAGEIFNGAKPANRKLLMLTALAPSLTAEESVALTGSEEAPRLLEYLYRRHLFVDRRRGAQTTYHYHALFREFLLAEARRRIPAEELREASGRAAERLAARGEANGALGLYRDAQDWESMRSLIRAHALEWARQGRGQTLSDWIDALPATMRSADPWLEYWRGRAWIFTDPARGRGALERAYHAFRTAGDVRGQALTLNTLVTGYYYEWANFTPLDRWLPEFERLLTAPDAPVLEPESELRARSAYLIVLLFRRPDDPQLTICAERLDRLIDGEPDVNARIMAASVLFNYCNWLSKNDMADALVARIEPALGQPDTTPLMQVWWRTHLSFWHYLKGRYDLSTAITTTARGVAERYGLETYLFEIDHAEATALIAKGQYEAALALLRDIEGRLSPARRMDWAYFHHLSANLHQRLGQFSIAVQAAERAVALARETGLPPLQMPHFLARLAHCRMSAGDEADGLRILDQAIALAGEVDRVSMSQQRELLLAAMDIARGADEAAARRIAPVLATYRAAGHTLLLRNRPDLAARIASFALEHDIETEYVLSLIARNGFVAPHDAGPHWPFPLRVHALGGFEILREGKPLRFAGKAQQRPLDLMKALVAAGGIDVDSRELMAALWPDADGAAAKASFDTTLFRLRKLLDIDHLLVLSGGKLSLSRTLAWTDVRALDYALAAASPPGEGHAQVDGVALAQVARRLLAVYRGNLLGSEEHPWVAQPRDALRARFVRGLLYVGKALETRADWPTAIDLYRRGLEADNLAEPLYRGLMRCLAMRGEEAEALNAFRRCRELLSIVLGMKPAAETERLQRDIVSGRLTPSHPAGAA